MQKLLTEISLDGKWTEVTNENDSIIYFIALKNAAAKAIIKLAKTDEAIDPSLVSRLTLEVGVESGVDGKYLTVDGIQLNFDEYTSSEEDLNKMSAVATRRGYFSKFYIRPTKIETKDGKTYTKGKSALSLNINLL